MCSVPVLTRRATGPLTERAMERSGVIKSDVGSDSRNRVLGFGETPDRNIPSQLILERLER